MSGKFEVYEDKAGKHRFRLKAGNGEVVAVGQAYKTQKGAEEGCHAVQRAAEGAQVHTLEGQHEHEAHESKHHES